MTKEQPTHVKEHNDRVNANLALTPPDVLKKVIATIEALKSFNEDFAQSYDVTAETARQLDKCLWALSYEFTKWGE
jgi:hypothetical protein